VTNNVIIARLEEVMPPELPEVLANSFSCNKCYVNRECMLFAAAASALEDKTCSNSVNISHRELLNRFTGHLAKDDFHYFASWNRLIDLESDSSSFHVAESWLVDASKREMDTSKTIAGMSYNKRSSLVLPDMKSSTITFTRHSPSVMLSNLCHLSFEVGCRVVVSTDSIVNQTATVSESQQGLQLRVKRRKMHLVCGMVEATNENDIVIRATKDDLIRIEKISMHSIFRIDKDERATGIGTLRHNLITLFAGADMQEESERIASHQAKLRRCSILRDILIRHRPPVFVRTLEKNIFNNPALEVDSVGIPGCNLLDLAREFAELNPDQQAAVTKVRLGKQLNSAIDVKF
jgi:DNA replication ATP-dependent helicase Dna2